VRLFALFQFAIAAVGRGVLVAFFWEFFIQVASSALQAPGRFFTVCPGVAKVLAVVTLRQYITRFICLHLDSNMAQACQFKYFCGFC
jgi:hypothetical protein